MKIMIVLGTRPEVIKLAPVIKSLKGHAEVIVCATGQHREMLKQALEIFQIKPDVDLQVMKKGQSLSQLSSKILTGMDRVLKEYHPEWLMVQGDTTSAFCAALAAFHLNIKIAHIEAGLRTGDLKNPFPEEANRSMIARIADAHFAPTQMSKKALIKEGIDFRNVYVSGNTVVDSIQSITSNWIDGMPKKIPDLIKNIIGKGSIILVTCHRRENFGDVILNIASMIKVLAEKYNNYQWVFPVHLNPEIRLPVMNALQDILNVHLIEPVNYEINLFLMSQSILVLTDSGGIQEEAPTFGVPVIIMRSKTERMEGVKSGYAKLAGQNSKGIEKAVNFYIKNSKKSRTKINPYGDGKAAKRIAYKFLNKTLPEFNG
jgi:UDP-N-acetylglucosamine 2-epimerase (non-hydrolysing)